MTGFVGLGLSAWRQNQAEDPDLYGRAYDEIADKGRRANLMAGLGLGIGSGLLATGVLLLILDRRKARAQGLANVVKVWMLQPVPRGIALSGRF